jgi:iron complex outermembrane receptor protein
VPGNLLINNYRSIGDIFRVSHDLGPGEVQVGGWFDHQSDIRAFYDLDMTNNGAYNYDMTPPPGALPQAAYTERLQHNQLFTRQAYGQYVWHVLPGLDVTAGDKYVNFQRVIVAPVNQSTYLPLDYSKTWTRNLPSVDVHYKLADNWSAYAQYAKGFLAPNLNTLYVANPSLNQLQPEGTTNVQLGTTWVGSGLTVSADVYSIYFSNFIQKHGGSSASNAYFINLGGVKYKGAEAEATYIVGAGFSAYANASWNSARLTADQTWVAETPNRTAALGVLYNQNSWQASLIDKYVGVRYGDTGNSYRLSAYSTADAAINYFVGPLGSTFKNGKIGVTVQNITDHRSIYFLNGYSNANNPLYFTLPGRSFQVNLSASF